jgi:chemotaxis protein histidine kinase CheA
MKDSGEYRITIPLNEEEYKKLKYITEYLKKYTKDSGTIPKTSAKLLSIIIEALDDKKTEAKTALLSTIDKENREKSIKAILEKFQNDQDNNIDSPKIIENLVFLSNVQKAIKKMEEDNIELTKEDKKTENNNKENKNKKEKETEVKTEENKAIEELQQPSLTQKEEKTETKVENKETKDKQDDEEEVLRFPDL